jgi:hypothetical protein
MRRGIGWIALIALWGVAAKADEPPEGCFCLQEADTALRQVFHGCERLRYSYHEVWHAECRYCGPDDTLLSTGLIPVDDTWTVLQPTDPDCAPCTAEALACARGKPVPRGEPGPTPDADPSP